MATTIITKYGSGAPTASDVVRGELAVDTENKRLYTEDSGGSVVELGTNPAANVTFGDNVKAIFGAGSDLQIYHTGTYSLIADTSGTGPLRVVTNTFQLNNAADTQNMINAAEGGAVTLYNAGNAKLATTSTGIDVTGTVTATKLVSANGVLELDDNGTHNGIINAPASLFINIDSDGNSTGEDFIIGKDRTSTSGGTELFRVQEDGKVGIGTSSPAFGLSVESDNGSGYAALFRKSSSDPALTIQTTSSITQIQGLNSALSATNDIAMQLSGGNVGIGTSSPSSALHISGDYASNKSDIQITNTNGGRSWRIGDGIGAITSKLVFFDGTASAARMVIDSSGNVGIGTSSPASELHVKGSTPDLRVENTTASETVSLSLIKTATKGFSINNKEISGTNYLTFNLDTAGAGTDALIIHPTDGSISTPTSGTNNLRLGSGAGASIASGGDENTVVGDGSGAALSTGDQNVGVGHNALGSLTTGAYNVGVGKSVLGTITTSSYNTAVGQAALGAATVSGNTAVGYYAGVANTSGPYNTYIGFEAGKSNLTADQNTLVGYGSGQLLTGGSNTAVGAFSMYDATSALNNTALGTAALYELTEGDNNTAVGRNALRNSLSATNNTAVGFGALQNNTTSDDNTAVGNYALFTQVGGSSNKNVAVGYTALYDLTSGVNNVAIGYASGENITTGNRNVVIGRSVSNSLQDGSDNVAIGDSVNVAASLGNSITIGSGISATGSNDFSFGKASNVVTNDFDTDANWSRSSDERLKKNITNQTLGLSFINDLRTVKYNWKASHELDATDPQLAHLYKEDPADNEMNTEATMHNFIAQEVKAALDTAGVSDFGGWKEDQYGVQQVSREMFVIPLVKAVQELSAKVDALTARIEALESN